MYHVMYIKNNPGERIFYTILDSKKTIAEALEIISGQVLSGVPESKLILVEQIDVAVKVTAEIGYNERGL